MIKFGIKTNITDYMRTYLKDTKRAVDKATISANNKVATQGANDAKRAVRDAYNVPASELNKATKVKRTNSLEDKPTIVVTGKPIGVIKYAARQTAKGVTIAIRKGKRLLLPSRFKAPIKAGEDVANQVFARKGNERLPIIKQVGPSAPDLMRSDRSTGAISLFIKTQYERIFNNELKWYKSK
jgi:hypothetical protein